MASPSEQSAAAGRYDWSGESLRWILDSVNDQDLMICQAAVQLARTPCGVVASSMEDLRRADLLKDDLSKHRADL